MTHHNNSYISKPMNNIIPCFPYLALVFLFLSFPFAWIIVLEYGSVFSAAEQVYVSYSEKSPECSE